MRETWLMSARKERSLQALYERYHGKNDILLSWEEVQMRSAPKNGQREPVEMDYIYNLRRRVHGYRNDLAYRGEDGFTESGKI